jgi:hypothetical protein
MGSILSSLGPSPMYAVLDNDGVDIHECKHDNAKRVVRKILADVANSPNCKGVYFYAHDEAPLHMHQFITEFHPKTYALSVHCRHLDFVIRNASDFTGMTELDVVDATILDPRIADAFPGLCQVGVRSAPLSLLLPTLQHLARGMKKLCEIHFKGSKLDAAHLVDFLDEHPTFCDRAWMFCAHGGGGRSDDVVARMLARRGIDYRTRAGGPSPFHEFSSTTFSPFALAEGQWRAAMLTMMASPPASASPCCKFMQRDGDRRIRKLVSQFLI